MASKAITVGVGIPMIVVGGLMAFLWAPAEEMGEFAGFEIGAEPLPAGMHETIEFVGSLIGILGVAFFIAGLFYTREPVLH